ncbi:hypothetical protein GA0070216_10378 [Micromonospora matsumotoense]|uniref:DUF5753 domain-containing protein n=1 Tax=Micromonospora matsumotoense TaxID=121616 RepID=A0A1C4W484_9ACTN|nr:DUF5753 domain-containing protein [Micromonospora matsumotoense]SCE90995.1 hypothetical protein GA0070216_10378 [Micromonospora matsumotoense]
MNLAVKEAMATTGETAESLAAQIGVDPKTAAKWASHGRIPQTRHRAKVAAVLGRDVLDLWPDALKRHEPVWFRRWADIEREAVVLRGFQLAWVPGLLQTEAYARATLAGEALTPDEVDELAAARVARSGLLRKPKGPLFVAIVDEIALRRIAPAIMPAQLAHIVECAQLDSVQLHVVPASAGVYAGLGGPFTVAELDDGKRVGHIDSQARAQIVDQPADIATLERRWVRIVGKALPTAQSLDLIRRLAEA